jgi:hypothetical protein
MLEHKDALLRTVIDAGVLHAVVSTLQHNLPFCAAAAAGALRLIGDAQDGDNTLMEGSGAIPALVRLIERPPRPGDSDLFRECVHLQYPICSRMYLIAM